MPTTSTSETSGDLPGEATPAPPIVGFILFIGVFMVVYWVLRAWFTRVAPGD
jgi:hypothetical protein